MHLLLAQADDLGREIAKQGRPFLSAAWEWIATHWYISIPAAFVLAFAIAGLWAKRKIFGG